ncbi:MAG: trimethylamine methyltransferase family protein [Gammaproteobacteria bacterium]
MDTQTKKRRGSARQAKHAQRLHKTTKAQPPVRAGFKGGHYKPLSQRDIERVHTAALDVLERVGMADAPSVLLDLACAKGCKVNTQGRLCFPRAFVEDIVANSASRVVLHGREERHDLDISGSRVHYGTGGAAVKVLDPDNNAYRSSTLTDLYDFARLVDRLDNVHWFTRCVIATDLEDWLEFDLNTAYACVAGTSKHIGTAITVAENVAPIVTMFDAVLGGEGRFRERPFCKLHTSPIVPPLRYGEDACKVIAQAVRLGMPINAITAAQSGATAPAPLAGTLVQTVAETLAALIFVQLLKPAHPFVFSNWPFVSDLRTGAFSGGGGEEAVLNAAAAQMSNFYGLPSGVAAGMTDSKIPDEQAGYEKALTTVLAGVAGANLVYESAGMLASLLGCSFEAFVIDDEMLGFVQRAVRGIEISEETLAVDLIEETVNGAGHFLGAGQTLEIMESEYVYPKLGDRHTPEEWQEKGATDIRERARVRAREILGEHYPSYIPPDVDADLRRRFPIRLPQSAMSPQCGRW